MNTIEHASYSSAQDILGCGLRYWLKKVKGYAEHPAMWSVGGVAVHKATELYDLGVMTDGTECFWEAWTPTLAEFEEATSVPVEDWRYSRNQDADWWIAHGPAMVQSWIDWRQASGWTLLNTASTGFADAIELPLNVDVGGVPLKGFIDRVFVDDAGAVVIMDLKTGSRKPDSALQLGWYRVGLKEQYGIDADWGAYFMPRKKPGDRVAIESVAKYDLEYISRMTAGFKAQVESGIYLPNVSSWCGSCGMRKNCWAQSQTVTDETPVPSLPVVEVTSNT